MYVDLSCESEQIISVTVSASSYMKENMPSFFPFIGKGFIQNVDSGSDVGKKQSVDLFRQCLRKYIINDKYWCELRFPLVRCLPVKDL